MEKEIEATVPGLLLEIGRCFWRELLSCAPLVALVALGCWSAPPSAYADCVAVQILALLVLNPLGLVGRIAAPVTRGALAAALLAILLALRLPWLTAYGRACLVAPALLTAAIALYTAPALLRRYNVRQSDAVDRVLAHLTHGGDFRAADAWERYGCRETRALLHQAVGMECPEPLICSSYRAVYLLGFLHGAAELEVLAARLERTSAAEKQLRRDRDQLLRQVDWLRQSEAEQTGHVSAVEYENTVLTERLREAAAPAPLKEADDEQVLSFIENGHSYGEAAAVFGISKSGAHKAAQRAKKKAEEETHE